jgi:hypothetical protein
MDVWCPFLCSCKITALFALGCVFGCFWAENPWHTRHKRNGHLGDPPTTSLTHAGHVLAPRWEAIKAASTWTKQAPRVSTCLNMSRHVSTCLNNPKSQEFSPSQDAAVADEISFNDLSQSMHGHSFIAHGCTIIFLWSVPWQATREKQDGFSEKFGYLKTSLKRLPQWTKGMWLGKTMSNDFHIIGTPSGIFITRSIRKLPDYVDWEYGCSNLWIPKLPLRRAFTNLSHPLAPFRTQPE